MDKRWDGICHKKTEVCIKQQSHCKMRLQTRIHVIFLSPDIPNCMTDGAFKISNKNFT